MKTEQLEQQIKELDFAKIRFRPDVVDLLNQLSVSQQAEIAAQIKKQTKKNTLNQVMQTTLDSYKGRIKHIAAIVISCCRCIIPAIQSEK